jgi:hypothetical protein
MVPAEAEGPGTADRAWPVRCEEDDQVDSLSGSALLMLEIGADFLLGITGGDFALRSGATKSLWFWAYSPARVTPFGGG